MLLDGHTHIFPEEVCRRRILFRRGAAFRLLYDSPKSKLVGPEDLLADLSAEGGGSRGGPGVPLAPGTPLAAAQRGDPGSPAPLAP